MNATLGAAVIEYLADRIPKAAREANRRFPLVEAADFEQEMWLRSAASAARFDDLMSEGHEELIYHELKRAGHRYGVRDDRDRRARKASAAGYSTYDEFFYTPQMAGHLLSELIQSEWDLPHAMERGGGGDLSGVRASSEDTQDSFMAYLVILTDVQTAFDKLRQAQQGVLLAWFAEGAEEEEAVVRGGHEQIANSMGLTYDAFRMRKNRALSALIRELGGENPYIKKSASESGAI